MVRLRKLRTPANGFLHPSKDGIGPVRISPLPVDALVKHVVFGCGVLIYSDGSRVTSSNLQSKRWFNLGVDSPFFSAIVLFNSQPFPHNVFGGLVERSGSLERMQLEVTPRKIPRKLQILRARIEKPGDVHGQLLLLWFPRVFGGFLERSGSLERMELEGTPGLKRHGVLQGK